MLYWTSLLFLILTIKAKAASIKPTKDVQVQLSSWPQGSYSIPMHADGCPEEEFEECPVSVNTERKNVFNLWPLDGLKVTSLENQHLTFHFCCKTSRNESYSWPSGTYCLLIGSTGQCPKGFVSGLIQLDGYEIDESKMGMFLIFCCRQDRSPDHAIQIPNVQPFYLYPHMGRTCQQVLGMTSKLQRILIDTEDENNTDSFLGSVPEFSVNKVGMLLYICQYTPSKQLELGTKEDVENEIKTLVEENRLPVRKDWPIGSYGMPMAVNTCPDGYYFLQSYLHQGTDDENNQTNRPKDQAMTGPKRSEGNRLHVCGKFDPSGSYEWPAGSYCIHRVGGICPCGFKEGSTILVDQKSRKTSKGIGQFPDGVFDTLLYFCCRNDGSSSQAISLPNQKTFYLYRHTSSCQTVANMTIEMQTIKWNDENAKYTNRNTGFTAAISLDDVGISLDLCWYKPRGALTRYNSWPRGRYSFPMTANENCPAFFHFKKGYFAMSVPSSGASSIVYGDDSKRYGIVDTGLFEGGFCTKDSEAGIYDWPEGRYCLNRVSGQCPDGFQDGSIYMDNDELEIKLNGFLPAELVDRNEFHFCCRLDGDYSKALKLPNSKDFIMWVPFKAFLDSYKCQSVEGMKASSRVMNIAIKPNGNSSVTGLTPAAEVWGSIYMLYCYYLPLQ